MKWLLLFLVLLSTAAEAKPVQRLATADCPKTMPLFDQLEGPGYPTCPYIGICFTNCFPSPDPLAEWNEANAYIRVILHPDGTYGYDCATQCRWRADQPRIPLPPGYTPARSLCPASQGVNVENYAWLDPATGVLKLGVDAGCWQ